MEAENVNKKVVSNLLWCFVERIGAEWVEFVVSIVLARLWAPEAIKKKKILIFIRD